MVSDILLIIIFVLAMGIYIGLSIYDVKRKVQEKKEQTFVNRYTKAQYLFLYNCFMKLPNGEVYGIVLESIPDKTIYACEKSKFLKDFISYVEYEKGEKKL